MCKRRYCCGVWKRFSGTSRHRIFWASASSRRIKKSSNSAAILRFFDSALLAFAPKNLDASRCHWEFLRGDDSRAPAPPLRGSQIASSAIWWGASRSIVNPPPKPPTYLPPHAGGGRWGVLAPPQGGSYRLWNPCPKLGSTPSPKSPRPLSHSASAAPRCRAWRRWR